MVHPFSASNRELPNPIYYYQPSLPSFYSSQLCASPPLLDICFSIGLTWISRAGEMRPVRVRGWMRTEELVVESHRASVTEFELIRTKVRETGRRTVLSAERARVQVQRKAAHFARAPEEGVPAHRRQLLQPALLAPLVLEPDLKSRRGRRPGAFNQLNYSTAFPIFLSSISNRVTAGLLY